MVKCLIKSLILLCFIIPTLVFSQEKDLQVIRETKEDIKIINLLNSLDLRKKQIEFIIQKAQEAEVVRKNASGRLASYSSELADIYNNIKQEVSSGKVTVDKQTAKKFRMSKKETEQQVHNSYSEIDAIAKSIEDNLEQFQLLALDGYKPCIIPVMTQGRIGQADKSQAIIKILERVKDIPQSRYVIVKDIFADRILERVKLKIPPFIKIDESTVKTNILSAFDEIRGMQDLDFRLKKKDLAEKLHDEIMPEKREATRLQKIRKFLLSEKVISILEERLKGF